MEEAKRCLDLGAKGIKLHPRAQAFTLDDERLPPIFELAVERSAPILIHGGRGLPPIAEHLATLVRHAGKVLTHRFLLREVWGPGRAQETHYLRVFMAGLRRKLEADPAQPRPLLTEQGVGYRLADD